MKRVMSVFVCFVLVLFSLSACAKSSPEDVLFLNDLIHCNIMEAGGNFGFNLLYLYKGQKPSVDFVAFDNANANAMFDDTIEGIAGKEYGGFKAVMLGFSMDISSMENGDELQINSITLSVNGTEKAFDTTGQIIVKKIADTEEKYNGSSLYSTNVPVVLFSQGKTIEAASFHYHTEQSVTLEDFEFSDFLEINHACVYVDDQMIGDIKDVFPLHVEADKSICIVIDADFGNYDSFSDYYVNSTLHYKSDEDGSKIVKDYIAIQAVGNFDDLSNLIDYKVQNK